MAEAWDQFCAICASHEIRGELNIALDTGDGAAPRALESMRLCTPCYLFVAEAAAAAAHGAWGATVTAGDGVCSFCIGSHEGDHFRADLVPTAIEMAPAQLHPLASEPSPYRLCRACLGWVRDLIDHESVTRWANRRPGDGPGDGWRFQALGRVLGFGLEEHDAEAVRETVESFGGRYFEAGIEHRPEPGDVVFVGVAADAAASRFAGAGRERGFPVIAVAHAADVVPAIHALHAGASDLLASPLSRQQVAGAFDRLSDASSIIARDAATGLPAYRLAPRFGLACHELAVRTPPAADELAGLLVMRRFLRGYDRIRAGRPGEFIAQVYCDPAEIGAVARRVGRILGSSHTITIGDSAHPGAVAPGTERDTAPATLPVAASAFFGKRRHRVG
ncbi:MAG: hypothetical protein HYX53_15290 [Chloroflexi bacterium]|nr:hypothetical protein [Chloroflexota bacterium]